MNIFFVSLGCDKNLVDSEYMLGMIRDAGYTIIDDETQADVIVINTCCFINDAKEESINTILEMAEYKKTGHAKALIVTGCLAQRYRSEIEEEIPEVDAILGTNSYDNIVSAVKEVMAGKHYTNLNSLEGLPTLHTKRCVTTGGHYAHLKIAEGCNNCCTYCAIPKIRGPYRSVPMDDVLEEAKWLAENGVTEIIVIAQDTTRYGEDLYGKSKLPELLEKLCGIDGLKWIRVLYCYPERITDELLEVIANQEKIVKYMDIPIQHCNGEILKRMNRRGDRQFLTELMKRIRNKVPDIVIRTTLITGFPGETQEQFEELAEFVKDMRFDRLGCFAYSQEEGTAAADFDGQLDEEIKTHRADIIMEQQQLISEEKNSEKMDGIFEAVVEGFDKWAECYFGRTAGDAPDIDGKIFFTSDEKLEIGQYVTVKITDTLDYDLIGEVISNESSK